MPALSFVMYAILMGATVSMIRGKNTRASIVVMILCIFYLKGARDSFSGDVHHRYIIPMQILFFFLLSKCGEVYSLDARHLHHREGVQEWEASWPIKTLQLYVALFYFWSVIAKVRVSGWVWFAGEGRIQEVLIHRSVRGGVNEQGDVLLTNALGFELAQLPGTYSPLRHSRPGIRIGVHPASLHQIRQVPARVHYGSHIFSYRHLCLDKGQFYFNSICLSHFFRSRTYTRMA